MDTMPLRLFVARVQGAVTRLELVEQAHATGDAMRVAGLLAGVDPVELRELTDALAKTSALLEAVLELAHRLEVAAVVR